MKESWTEHGDASARPFSAPHSCERSRGETPCEMDGPSLSRLEGALLPPFFKAAGCGVSFRRARGALRCYAQNLSSSAGQRRGSHEIRSFGRESLTPREFDGERRTPRKRRTYRGKKGKEREERRKGNQRTTARREHRLDRFCSDERVMDIKWTHGTHRQINSIYEVLLLTREVLTNIYELHTRARRVRARLKILASPFSVFCRRPESFADTYRIDCSVCRDCAAVYSILPES